MINALGNYLTRSNTGSSLLRKFGGAAAAYSLQNINAGGNVIRARRSLDNEERDFTAGQISDPLRKFAMNDSDELLGFAKAGNRMYFDGVDDRITLASQISLTGDFTLKWSAMQPTPPARSFVFSNSTVSYVEQSSSNTINVKVSSGSSLTLGAASTPRNANQVYNFEVRRSGSTVSYYLDGVFIDSGTLAGTVQIAGLSINNASLCVEGLLYDLEIHDDATGTSLLASYQGYGNTDADWLDTTGGGNDGTVNGSPALWTGQGFDAFVTTWYDQSQALGQPLSRFANRAQSADERMDFDGSSGKYISFSTFSNQAFYGCDVTFYNRSTIDSSTTAQALLNFDTSGSTFADVSFGASTGAWADEVITITQPSGARSAVRGVTINPGIHTLSIRWNGSSFDVTLDGVPQSVSESGVQSSFTAPELQIGGPRPFYGAQFDGLIYDVSLFDSNLDSYLTVNGYGNTDADWEDQVGSNDGTVNGSPGLYEGRNALQSTSSAQPQIVANGVIVTDDNGNYGPEWFGSGYHMSVAGLSISESTVFSVVQSKSAGSGNRSIYQLGTINQVSSLFQQSPLFYARRDSQDITTLPLAGTTLYSHLAVNDRGELWSNGASQGASETNVSMPVGTVATIGALNSSTYPWLGHITELIIYDSDQSANREAIEANIASRYGITLS